MADIWDTIKEMNPLDKKVIYETILNGISPAEAHKLWAGSLAFQGENSFPMKVRRGDIPVPEWIMEQVSRLEVELKENGIMPSD